MQIILAAFCVSYCPFWTQIFWLSFFVHPRNEQISLQRLLVWYYIFTTIVPLMQTINAYNWFAFCVSYCPCWTQKCWLRFFVHPRFWTISLQPMRVWCYNFTTTFRLVQPINAEIVTMVCILRNLWPWIDLQALDKAYHTVTTTIF